MRRLRQIDSKKKIGGEISFKNGADFPHCSLKRLRPWVGTSARSQKLDLEVILEGSQQDEAKVGGP